MLVEIENFEGVVIFTTNLLSNYDDAFRRRILANLEFTYPDEMGREQIWSVHIPKELPLEKDISPTLLAKKYEGITGADIKDIVLNAAVFTLQAGRNQVSWEEFDRSYQFIKQRYVDNSMTFKKETISEEQYKKELEEIQGGM
jgi:ATP-dependent 26S proteasome regulatory subunit